MCFFPGGKKAAFFCVIRLRSALSPSSSQKRMAGTKAGGYCDWHRWHLWARISLNKSCSLGAHGYVHQPSLFVANCLHSKIELNNMEWQSLLDSWLFFSWNCWYHGDFLTSSWLFGLGERSPFVPRLRGDGHQTTGQISQEQLPFSHEPSFLCFWLQGAPFFFEHVFFSGKLKKYKKCMIWDLKNMVL